MKNCKLEQEQLVKDLENKLKELDSLEKEEPQTISPNVPQGRKPITTLPKLYQKIKFQLVGNKNESLEGKVLWKHKNGSMYKNTVIIKFDDGFEKEFNFPKEVLEWNDINEPSEEESDPCCLLSFSIEKDIFHETYATILTRSQVKGKPKAEKAMKDEIQKFQDFKAFQKVKDDGQYAIKTR